MMKTIRTEVLIVGAGPAGMYCADTLWREGLRDVVLIDSGYPMQLRKCPQTMSCDCKVCSILEGGGGAGGFSDGKMTLSLGRGTQNEQLFSPEHQPLLDIIDKSFLEYGFKGVEYTPVEGTPPEFKDSKLEFSSYRLRHIGSDGAQAFIEAFMDTIRNEIKEYRPLTRAVKIEVDTTGHVHAVVAEDLMSGDMLQIYANRVCIATGLQGTPWVENQLECLGLSLGTGPAGLGVRFEAPYEALEPLFSKFYDFKLTYRHGPIELRSFCCNRRGHVVNEHHNTMGIRNVNGHSYLDPNQASNFSNFAIIAKIPTGYVEDPQAYVRRVSRKINRYGKSMPMVQNLRDFLGIDRLRVGPRTNPTATLGRISSHLDQEILDAYRGYFRELAKLAPDILDPVRLAHLYAPEMKYYGKKVPVDDKWRCTKIGGLYVLGNASGYLDSFVSAAVTGIIAANDILGVRMVE